MPNAARVFLDKGNRETAIFNCAETYPKFKPLLKAVEAVHTYIVNNAPLMPNYGERYQHGEAITTGFVEPTVHQVISKRFCKKQQIQWSKRASRPLTRHWALCSSDGISV